VFVDKLTCSVASEVGLKGYRQHKAGEKAEKPWTESERSLEQMKKEQAAMLTEAKPHSYLSSVSFPLLLEAERALKKLANDTTQATTVVLGLDLKLENVYLDQTSTSTPSLLVSAQLPRYLLFKPDSAVHTKEVIFIYNCPKSSSIKERMVYSSCRAGVLQQAKEAGLDVVKKLEIQEASELSHDDLQLEKAQPFVSRNIASGGFRKPAPPAGRAPYRHN